MSYLCLSGIKLYVGVSDENPKIMSDNFSVIRLTETAEKLALLGDMIKYENKKEKSEMLTRQHIPFSTCTLR